MSNNLYEFDHYHEIVECLVGALEAKDAYTSGHSKRVSDMSTIIAKQIGMKGFELEKIHMASHIHDIGKIGIPDSLLNKKGTLSNDEWAIVKKHPLIGFKILNTSNKLKEISEIVLYHHERWDGKGYPYNLKSKEIPIGSRIIAISDTIDAMTSKRPYREPMDLSDCKEEIENEKSYQFDPYLVDACRDLWNEFENIILRI
ncbi:MAG: HD domain-containing protein [Firmicutes bacterium]|nr:HD domain-containing protein [Bacillota bacterium]